MSTRAVSDDPSNLLLPEPPPADRHPAELYLATRAPRSRDAARTALSAVGALLTAGRATAETLAWHALRDAHVRELRAALAERYPAPAANRMLAALRGVLKQSWQLGLISTEDYRRADTAAAANGNQVSRSGLRSVFESCVEDGSPSVERGGAVRTLLYGDGAREHARMTEAPGQRPPAASVRGNAMSMERLHLRRVAPREAIAHALWEAGVCLRSSAFCASLVMLRRALGLWSADYGERHGWGGDEAEARPGNLGWRLRKIAEDNKLHSDTIRTILDHLGDETHDPHAGIACRGGYATGYDGYALTRIKETYRNLHELVITLITATTPELPL